MTIKSITMHHGDLPDNVTFGNVIAMDCEMTGLDPVNDKLCLVQMSDDGEDVHLVKFDISKPYNAPNLCKIMTNESQVKIFHFAIADAGFMTNHLNITPKNLFCTKMASKVGRPTALKHSLSNITKELLNIELSKEQQLSDWSVETLTDEQIQYAASDVEHLHKLKAILDKEVANENMTEVLEGINAFIPTLAKLEISGFDSSVLNHH